VHCGPYLELPGLSGEVLVFHTYQERPMTHALVPMTANEKATIAARLKETNNCGANTSGRKL
jgi:hypothetical protein